MGISSWVNKWVDEIKRINEFMSEIKRVVGPLPKKKGCKIGAEPKIEIRCKFNGTRDSMILEVLIIAIQGS